MVEEGLGSIGILGGRGTELLRKEELGSIEVLGKKGLYEGRGSGRTANCAALTVLKESA